MSQCAGQVSDVTMIVLMILINYIKVMNNTSIGNAVSNRQTGILKHTYLLRIASTGSIRAACRAGM